GSVQSVCQVVGNSEQVRRVVDKHTHWQAKGATDKFGIAAQSRGTSTWHANGARRASPFGRAHPGAQCTSTRAPTRASLPSPGHAAPVVGGQGERMTSKEGVWQPSVHCSAGLLHQAKESESNEE